MERWHIAERGGAKASQWIGFDVAAIRTSTGLSQGAFARSIGVAKGTLLNWEHGRRRPTDPAQVLLAIIAKKPSLVRELLR